MRVGSLLDLKLSTVTISTVISTREEVEEEGTIRRIRGRVRGGRRGGGTCISLLCREDREEEEGMEVDSLRMGVEVSLRMEEEGDSLEGMEEEDRGEDRDGLGCSSSSSTDSSRVGRVRDRDKVIIMILRRGGLGFRWDTESNSKEAEGAIVVEVEEEASRPVYGTEEPEIPERDMHRTELAMQ
jgi:hypothetical protein